MQWLDSWQRKTRNRLVQGSSTTSRGCYRSMPETIFTVLQATDVAAAAPTPKQPRETHGEDDGLFSGGLMSDDDKEIFVEKKTRFATAWNGSRGG